MIRVAVVSLFLAVPAAALAEDKPLTPEEAGKQVGKVVTVEMKVVSFGFSASEDGLAINLDSKDFSAKTGVFKIQLGPGVTKTEKPEKLMELGKRLKGKTVRAKGKVRTFGGETTGWTISVNDPADFKVIDDKK